MVGLATDWTTKDSRSASMIPLQAFSKAYLSGSSSRKDTTGQGIADSSEHFL